MNPPLSSGTVTPRSAYFMRGAVIVGLLERAMRYPPAVVLSFVLVVGAYMLVHRWVLVAARKRLESAARRAAPRFPAPRVLTAVRVTGFAGLVLLGDQSWPLAFALIAAASSITLVEIVILRFVLRRVRLRAATA